MKSRLLHSRISALILSIAFIITAGLPLQAQTVESYVPALQASDGADLGLALVNPTLAEARMTLTARSYNGSIIRADGITNPVSVTLPASGQVALRTAELFGSGISGQAGWVEISASTPAVKGFFLSFDSGLSFIDGAELARPAGRLVFAKGSASGSPTELSLVNTASHAVQGTIALYRNDGQLFAAHEMNLPALSGFNGSIAELVPGAVGFEGYAVVQAADAVAGSLIGFETYRNRSDIALIRAFPESARLRKGFLAHLAVHGGYSTTLTMVNASDHAQVLQITADGLESGGSARDPSSVTVTRTLAPHARLEERVDEMFSLPDDDLIAGYIRFETQTDSPGVMAFLDYGTTDGTVLSAVEAQGEGYSNLFFSHVAEGAGYYTGLAVLNPNTEPAIVTLDAFDAAGNRTGSTILNLKSGQREAHLLSEFLERRVNQLGGYIRLTATRPIVAFELFGSRDSLTFLASVPAQGEALKPQASGREIDASIGANVISDDGSTSLLVPPKALKSNAAIKVKRLNLADLPQPAADQQPVLAVEATPAGTQFDIPVRLTFPLNADLDPGTQIPLLIFDPQTRTYQRTEFTAIVDNSGRTASAEVTHFTQYVGTLAAGDVTISGIAPSTAAPGDTITITGSGFRNPLTVTFAGANNTSIKTPVLSYTSTSIQVVVPNGAVSGAVIVKAWKQTSTGYPITVSSPTSGNPAPGTISISPSSVVAGTSSVVVEIAGTGFISSSIVNYDGAPIAATFVDNTLLRITLTSLSTATIHQIRVVNPAPGGGTSNTVDFTVTAAAPPPPPPSSGGFIISTALALDKTSVSAGQTLNATVTFKNTGSSAITVNDIVITSRPPGGTNGGGPYNNFAPESGLRTVAAGATIQLSASRAFTSADPTGTWYAFATYQDASSVWHDGPNVYFTVGSAPAPAPPPTNLAPVVNAGADQTITLPASANLNGTATDDGLPTSSTLATTWSKVSGPGTVTFGSVSARSTTVSFSLSGSYVVRLTASDGALSSTDDVVITVNPASLPPATGGIIISTPLALDKTTVQQGQSLNATVTYKNTSSAAISINAIVIASRPPGGTNSGGPYNDLSPTVAATTIQAGATVQLAASRAFTTSDPTGAWYAFATYQDAAGVWHDGPSVNYTVTVSTAPAPPPPPPPTSGLSIRVVGNKLVNGSGQTIRLLGVNRPGGEYACVQNWGIFDGPMDAASVQAIKSWNVNAVRIPMNEACWLGINGVSPAYSGSNYQNAVVNYVNLLHQYGIYAILDLQWAAAGSTLPTGQAPMANMDHSPAFWTSVATKFKNDPAVLFDLYNEPFSISDSCWRDGCSVSGYQAAGMQTLINTVRATGATQPILVTGNGWGNNLGGYLSNRPTDPNGQMIASVHIYNFTGCNTQSCWDSWVKPLTATFPTVSAEFGETTCSTGWVNGYMNYLDSIGVGYLGWGWYTTSCSGDPALITSYSGTPTAYGVGLRDHLKTQTVLNIKPGNPPAQSASADPRIPLYRAISPVGNIRAIMATETVNADLKSKAADEQHLPFHVFAGVIGMLPYLLAWVAIPIRRGCRNSAAPGGTAGQPWGPNSRSQGHSHAPSEPPDLEELRMRQKFRPQTPRLSSGVDILGESSTRGEIRI